MKRLLVQLAVLSYALFPVLVSLVPPAGAAELGKRGKKEYMGVCGEREAGSIYAMTNGSNAASCDASQAVGALRIYCSCTPDGAGGYAWGLLDTALGGEAVDLTPYALLAGDADGQTIQGRTGADQARIELDIAENGTATVWGAGAGAASIHTDANSACLNSAGGESLICAQPLAWGGLSIGSAITSGSGFVWTNDGDGTLSIFKLGSGNVFGVDVNADDTNDMSFSSSSGFAVSAVRIQLVSTQTPPATASSTCAAGDTIDTATFHYYCHTTDTWVRVAMATW